MKFSMRGKAGERRRRLDANPARSVFVARLCVLHYESGGDAEKLPDFVREGFNVAGEKIPDAELGPLIVDILDEWMACDRARRRSRKRAAEAEGEA